MEMWEKIIIEWIDCLQVQKESIKNITELENGEFYVNFLKLINWNTHDSNNQENIIIKFLEAEYPSFKINKDDSTEHLYIASLLLIHTCRKLSALGCSLQYNMCNNLKHESQIKIKTFVESVLPLEREITKETIREIIMEIKDTTIIANSRTPPIGKFSPITCSTRSKKIMTDRMRELRNLKRNLEEEESTNVNLRSEIMIQNKKIQKLQNQLEEKSMQIKLLREERMRSSTPQPSQTKEDDSQENYYKQYIDDLESQLNKQQDEITKLETDKDTLSKELSCMKRTHKCYIEEFTNHEQSIKSLSKKIDIKDRELVELRIQNEELRTRIKELDKNFGTEQSFEVEDLAFPARISLNASEALSSVIDIQLQEAKEECAILQAQNDTLNGKLNILTKDYKTVMELNRDLQKKVETLDQVQIELNNVQEELKISNIDIVNLHTEKISLIAQNEDLKTSLLSKETELSKTEQSNIALNTELINLKANITNLNILLEEENTNSANLNTAITQIKSEVTQHLARIHKLIEERDLFKSSIENCNKSLKDILHSNNQVMQVETNSLDNLSLNDLIKYIEALLDNCNTTCISYKYDIEKLKSTIDELNTNLSKQQLIITTLEEKEKQNLIELANIEENNKQKDVLLNEQKEIIYKYSQEIEVLKNIRDEKLVLELNLREVTNNLINRELQLNSLTTQLKDIFQNVKKDLKIIKKENQQSFTEYQESVELNFKKLQYSYQEMHYNFNKTQKEKEKLEYNLNRNKDELSNIQIVNAKLQQNLLESKKTISSLEEKRRVLCNELNESKQTVQDLKRKNQALEEQYKTMETEANNNLESLKSKNAKISFEFQNATDKLSLLQQEINDTITQMKLKEAQIHELLLNVSSLKTEKENLMHSHEETLKTKDKEIEMKEEALLMSQAKMVKLTNEANDMEKKMKEIIINLQEVRSSQDAVLATQETALKEKCLFIEELQEQFDNSKEILNKDLENAKLSLREYQIKLLNLENQANDQNKTIAKLQETLTEMNIELETNREHYKQIDESQIEIVKLCQELEQPTKNLNSTIMETCSDFDFLDQELYYVPQNKCTYTDHKITNILNIIKMSLSELYKSEKVILHLSSTNAELNKTLTEQKILVENNVKDKEEIHSLKNKVRELEIIAQKRNSYIKNLIQNKESLKDFLQKMVLSQNDLYIILTSSKQKWSEILTKFQHIFHIESSICDEFKQLQFKKISLENTLSKYQIAYLENIKSVFDILWKKFLWTEQQLHDTYLCSIHEKECLDALTSVKEDLFANEKMIIDIEMEKHQTLQTNVLKYDEEIDSFTALATFYEYSLKSGEIKNQAEVEKKLQNQINQLTNEKRDLKNKVDAARLRNVKLEKSIDDLRMEIKKLKSAPMEVNLVEVQSLKDELRCLKEQNQQLREKKDVSSKIAKHEFENQIKKEVHATYEQKLEDMKQNMKIAYNEQIMKLKNDNGKIIQEKLQIQMKMMCQKQREELNRYKAHVGDLSSQLWSVGEKLLVEQQQKQDALQRVKELKTKLEEIGTNQPITTISRKTCKIERKKQEVSPENIQTTTSQKVTTLITEETFERRHSLKSMQAMGNVFKTEDEEEIFDNVYLADIKRGSCLPITDVNRLSVLQMRNSLCKPHLKSSYPAEMQFLSSTLTEEEIKMGSPVEDNFNDSLSQSLLPEQKAKKRDKSQISYKKPGPPTPSKNGGRLSLQGNELKSPNSRILRERNIDRRTATTPHSLKNIFSKRQDENVSSTPKRRLSNLFRKSRVP